MADQSPVKFEYQDKYGRVTTNRPEVLPWAVSAAIALPGAAKLVLAIGMAVSLCLYGGSLGPALSHLKFW